MFRTILYCFFLKSSWRMASNSPTVLISSTPSISTTVTDVLDMAARDASTRRSIQIPPSDIDQRVRKQSFREHLGVKGNQIIQSFSHTDKTHRKPQLVAKGDCDAAFRRSIQFRQYQ